MFESCHTASEVAYIYRRMGIPVSVTLDRVAVIAGRDLGAVAMPSQLGSLVHEALLEDSRCGSVPVFTHARSRREEWVFLVGPAWGGKIAHRTLESLREHGVRLLDSGQRVWLPMSDHPTGWRWISEPVESKKIPSRSSVIADARNSIGRLQMSTAWT
ncbi:hypothetical protein [Nocardia noduli]|uniref:hypothetical protein n=1 Tax=Nocardia noduli TaxID=2815722 RepID=UPI001C2424F0|nr:hypothetical protein [Nocardia noduli]